MKKILAQYPSVFYQLLVLVLVEEICFSFFSFNIYNLLDSGNISENGLNPIYYISLVSSVLYILSGIIIDRLEDQKKALHLGVLFLLLGFVIVIFAKNSSIGPIGAISFLYFGHSIFFIYCLMHVGAFFPVANDWKDNAFLILFASSQILGILLILILVPFADYFELIYSSDIILTLVGIAFWVLLFYLIGKFNDVGFSVSSEEDSDLTNEESSNLRSIMIGLILVAIIFSFITTQLYSLGKIESFESSGLEGLIQSFGVNEFVIIDYALKFSLVIGIIVSLKFAKYRSTHFSKISWVLGILLLLAGVEWGIESFGNSYFDYFLESAYGYIASYILFPIFLSIMTHVNLDKNLGFWIGVLLAVPSLVNQFEIQFLYSEKTYYFAPFVAVILLIVFIIVFRENREFLEEKLALNESNREEGDDENDIDLIEHFVEK